MGCRPNKPAVTPGRRCRHGAKPKGAKPLEAVRLGYRPNKPAATPGRRCRHGAKPKGAKPLEAVRLGYRPNKPAVTPDRRWRHGAKPKGARQRPWRPCVLSPEGENKPAVTPDRRKAVWGEGSFRGFGRLCAARGAPLPTRKAPRNPKNSGALSPILRAFSPRAPRACARGRTPRRGIRRKGIPP